MYSRGIIYKWPGKWESCLVTFNCNIFPQGVWLKQPPHPPFAAPLLNKMTSCMNSAVILKSGVEPFLCWMHWVLLIEGSAGLACLPSLESSWSLKIHTSVTKGPTLQKWNEACLSLGKQAFKVHLSTLLFGFHLYQQNVWWFWPWLWKLKTHGFLRTENARKLTSSFYFVSKRNILINTPE